MAALISVSKVTDAIQEPELMIPFPVQFFNLFRASSAVCAADWALTAKDEIKPPISLIRPSAQLIVFATVASTRASASLL